MRLKTVVPLKKTHILLKKVAVSEKVRIFAERNTMN